MILALVFLLGLAVGSFLNVCIRRIPAHESVVRPASRCPGCQTPIKPYDNIPVLSYFLLGGKCRACRAPISPVYPTVELLAGLLFAGCYLAFGLTLGGVKWAFFSSLLVVLFFTDIADRVLPDKVNFLGLAVGLGVSFFSGPNDGAARWISSRLFEFPPPDSVLSFVDAVLGAAVGSGMLWAVAEGYFRLRGREGMGLGDVKMMAMAGAFLGAQRTLLTILGGSLLGSALGLLFIAVRSKGADYELPFGAFLAAAALLVVFWGTPLLDWYGSYLTIE